MESLYRCKWGLYDIPHIKLHIISVSVGRLVLNTHSVFKAKIRWLCVGFLLFEMTQVLYEPFEKPLPLLIKRSHPHIYSNIWVQKWYSTSALTATLEPLLMTLNNGALLYVIAAVWSWEKAEPKMPPRVMTRHFPALRSFSLAALRSPLNPPHPTSAPHSIASLFDLNQQHHKWSQIAAAAATACHGGATLSVWDGV